MFLVDHNRFNNVQMKKKNLLDQILTIVCCHFPQNAILHHPNLCDTGATVHFLNVMDLENTLIPKNPKKILPSWMRIDPHFFTFSEFIVTEVKNARYSVLGADLPCYHFILPF